MQDYLSKTILPKRRILTWLNQFGTLGTFLKNDIKLIKRNKRSKTTVGMSIMFLFYGLIFFSGGVEAHDKPIMQFLREYLFQEDFYSHLDSLFQVGTVPIIN